MRTVSVFHDFEREGQKRVGVAPHLVHVAYAMNKLNQVVQLLQIELRRCGCDQREEMIDGNQRTAMLQRETSAL